MPTNNLMVEKVASFLEPEIMAHTGEQWKWRQDQERKYARRLLEETGIATAIEAAGVERLVEALRPFARVAERFGAIEGGIVEICRPHPDNPSPNIMPFGIEHFNRARATLTSQERG